MGGNYNEKNYREWMYKRIDERTNNISAEFVAGVEKFMAIANAQPIAQSSGGQFYCPCIRCKNNNFLPGQQIELHLYSTGFMPGYYIWYMHGEQWNVDLGGSSSRVNTSNDGRRSSEDQNEHAEDRYVTMVNDAFPDQTTNNDHNYSHVEDQGYQNVEEPNIDAKKFYDMLEAAKNPLYDGCQEGQSQLSLAARFMNIKAEYNLSERCMDSWTELFKEYLPENNQSTGSYYETEKLMRNLGLPVHTTDVCIHNCMIFLKDDERLDKCKFCEAPRYKTSEGRTKIPFSRMWYLPIADRLKRMYQSEQTAAIMRWHAEHESEEGEMCHPSVAEEWKNFQQLHPGFANEHRNVYLGLCTDGFNPFGISRNHSLWPIIVTPYNLPPSMCMNEEYLWLTIFNSGPTHPRASLDIFLRPLIDELKELWTTGVEAYDVSQNQNFNLRAVLMWTISDFPAYGMLSGWTTHGRLACPICMDDTKAFQLPNGRKTCWFDCHRRYLPHGHPLRRNKSNFLKGKDALNDYPPQALTGEEVLYERIREVKPPKTSDCGGNGHEVKKKGYGKWHNWHKESIFWELPYWTDLRLRHNLDVMHIEKNFFDNIMYTLMNVKDKSKDTVKARLDLARFCSRKKLHIDSQGIAPVPIFRLTQTGKERLLTCVKNDVKFPDGYSSDLASCVDIEGGKFSGMKSHDCHVFMERLLPFIFAELLPQNVHLALSGIGGFFRDLCSRTLQQNRVRILKDNIVIILCNLEKIFPPAFFDVMEHLPVHLPYEAELGGPVQYRWMYPFERFFKKLKSKAKNKRYAAGSIVQSYLNDEISYFSEHYFAAHIHTKSRSTRFDEGEVPVFPVAGLPDIFTHVGRHSGKSKELWLSEKEYKCAHAYVLRNCDYFRKMERLCYEQIRCFYPELSEDQVTTKLDEEFPTWVKDHVNLSESESFPQWVKELVQGPRTKVDTWPMYFTRGYLFHTQKHGHRRKTCNYGICVKGANYSESSDELDFYGTLIDIIQLEYPGLVNLKVTIFKCDWYDPMIGKGVRKSASGVVDVHSTRKYQNYEPFILASQADQVCYIPYPYTKQPKHVWLNVCKVNPRGNISGNFKNTRPTLLQQENDEDVTIIEDIEVDHLAIVSPTHDIEDIDFEVRDVEAEDEFQCNISSSDDDDTE